MDRTNKICAACCWGVYIVVFLFLPFIEAAGYGIAGMDMISYVNSWCIVPLIVGFAVGVCVLLLPAKIGGALSIFGTFVTLITFLLVRSYGLPILTEYLGRVSSVVMGLLHVGMGFGTVLCVLLGIGSAVLCFMSGFNRRPKTRNPGLTSDSGDEW